MGKSVCVRCEDLVAVKRRNSAVQVMGLLAFLTGFFAFWPISLVGFVMMIGSKTRRLCPQCGYDELVPPGSAAGMRIMEGRLARLEARRRSL